jgi:hypothetical protein
MVMRWFLFCLLYSGLIFINSCSEDDSNPVSCDCPAPGFALYFDVDLNARGKNVDVEFMTTNLSEVPSVVINNKAMELFEVREGSIQGIISNMSYSAEFTFEISAGGKTTSGSIQMPADITAVTCNGKTIIEDSTVYVEAAETYNFAWTSGNADYFICGFSNTTDDIVESKLSKTPSVSYDATGYTRYRFEVRSFVGSLLESGAKPNASGSYGAGYVVAESYNQDFRITNINAEKVELVPATGKDVEDSKIEVMRSLLGIR